MFDKIHQKFCNNKTYMYFLERFVHIECCIIHLIFYVVDFFRKDEDNDINMSNIDNNSVNSNDVNQSNTFN
jgi:hypothetical protein